MRCKSYQLLGHTTKRCKNAPACVNCNLLPHSPTECTRTMCANCQENHAASFHEYIQQKQILSIKNTIKKPKEIHNYLFSVNAILPPNSYADMVSSTQKGQSNNNNTNDKNNTITQNIQHEKTYISPSNNNIHTNNCNSGTTNKNITNTNTNSTNISFHGNTNLHKAYSAAVEHTSENNNSNSHSLNTVINANPDSNNVDSLNILPLKIETTNITEIEFSSDAEDIQQNLDNYINSNSPSFLPLNSLNAVLTKSFNQSSFTNSSDFD